MEITIVGSGTAVPQLHRASPCVLARIGGATVLCDTGPGTLRQMLKAGVGISQVDMILYSHLHLDHTADLAPFLFAAKYSPGARRSSDLTILGPVGIARLYERLQDAYGTWVVPQDFSVSFIEVTDGTMAFADFTVSAAPVAHTDSSIGVRLQDRSGSVVVYSGDTDYCRSIVELAAHADLLILECSFPEHLRRDGHLIPSLAGKIARESACRKLVLTHLYPEADMFDLITPLRGEFSGEAVIAQDLMTFRL